MSARRGISLMILQSVLFAAETAIVHHIGTGASFVQLSLLRGLGGVVLALALASREGWSVLASKQVPLQLLRGAVSCIALWALMYVFGRLPFADATSISYTQTIFIAAFSALVLRERITRRRVAAIAIGIVGAAFITRPGFAQWNAAYLVALLGAGANGLAFVLNKFLQRPGGDSSITTLFYVSAITVASNVPFAASALPPPEVWPWLPGVILLGPIGGYAGILAVRHGPASALGPYVLLRLVFGFVGGALVFREMPDAHGLVGALVILASCLLAAPRLPRPACQSARLSKTDGRHSQGAIRARVAHARSDG